MTDNITGFPPDATPDDLFAEYAGQLTSVIVMGTTHDGQIAFDAAGHDSLAVIIGIIETAKQLWIMEALGDGD